MTVVEEPAEGELVEAVVVAVDVLVALRPATINDSVEISKMAGTQNVESFSIDKMLYYCQRQELYLAPFPFSTKL